MHGFETADQPPGFGRQTLANDGGRVARRPRDRRARSPCSSRCAAPHRSRAPRRPWPPPPTIAPQATSRPFNRSSDWRAAIGGRVGIDRAIAEAAHQPQRRLLAFEIAAEPEQIVGRAARQIAEQAHDAHLLRRGQQARRLDRACRRAPRRRRIRRLRPSRPRARRLDRKCGRSRPASRASRRASRPHRRAARRGAARAGPSPIAASSTGARSPGRHSRRRARRCLRPGAPRSASLEFGRRSGCAGRQSRERWSLNAPAMATSSSRASTCSRSARLAAPPGGDVRHDAAPRRSAVARGSA